MAAWPVCGSRWGNRTVLTNTGTKQLKLLQASVWPQTRFNAVKVGSFLSFFLARLLCWRRDGEVPSWPPVEIGHRVRGSVTCSLFVQHSQTGPEWLFLRLLKPGQSFFGAKAKLLLSLYSSCTLASNRKHIYLSQHHRQVYAAQSVLNITEKTRTLHAGLNTQFFLSFHSLLFIVSNFQGSKHSENTPHPYYFVVVYCYMPKHTVKS